MFGYAWIFEIPQSREKLTEMSLKKSEDEGISSSQVQQPNVIFFFENAKVNIFHWGGMLPNIHAPGNCCSLQICN